MHPSIARKDQSMPSKKSYSNRPASHSRRKTPASTHSWKRSWAVEPGQNLVAFSAFHGMPVRRTKKMASAQTRSGVRGRPPPKRCVFSWTGSCASSCSHSRSGTRQSAALSKSVGV
jgi:hypothetical protein